MKTYKEVTEVTVDRKKWARGSGSRLLVGVKSKKELSNSIKVGQMCCLGFFCLQAGVSRKRISNLSNVDYFKTKDVVPKLSQINNSSELFLTNFAREAERINDDCAIQDNEREEKLIKLFAKNGVTLRFIN